MPDDPQTLRAEHLAAFLNASHQHPDRFDPAVPHRRQVRLVPAVVTLIGIGAAGLALVRLPSAPEHSQKVLAKAAPVTARTDERHRTTPPKMVNSSQVDRNKSNRQTNDRASLAIRDLTNEPMTAKQPGYGNVIPAPSEVASHRQQTLPAKQPATIEPYRNGTMATRLTGEPLRLALMEDRRLTKEMNEAALRQIRAGQSDEQRNGEQP